MSTASVPNSRRPVTQISASQPPRFAARSQALRDPELSHGALRLFLLLDDEARGEGAVRLSQHHLGVLMDTSPRELQRMLLQLAKAGYLTTERTGASNIYRFTWAGKTHVRCDKTDGSDASEMSYRMRQKRRIAPISGLQEFSSPPTPHDEPYREDDNAESFESTAAQIPTNICRWCHGSKFCGTGSQRSACGGCRGTGARRGCVQ